MENGQLILSTTAQAKRIKIWPNHQTGIKDHPAVGAIATFRSDRDYAFSEESLLYLTKAQENGKIVEAYVLLLVRNGIITSSNNQQLKFVAAPTLEAITAYLGDTPPREGNWGRYWWLREADLIDPDSVIF